MLVKGCLSSLSTAAPYRLAPLHQFSLEVVLFCCRRWYIILYYSLMYHLCDVSVNKRYVMLWDAEIYIYSHSALTLSLTTPTCTDNAFYIGLRPAWISLQSLSHAFSRPKNIIFCWKVLKTHNAYILRSQQANNIKITSYQRRFALTLIRRCLDVVNSLFSFFILSVWLSLV